jgi:hypothetical protein
LTSTRKQVALRRRIAMKMLRHYEQRAQEVETPEISQAIKNLVAIWRERVEALTGQYENVFRISTASVSRPHRPMP